MIRRRGACKRYVSFFRKNLAYRTVFVNYITAIIGFKCSGYLRGGKRCHYVGNWDCYSLFYEY